MEDKPKKIVICGAGLSGSLAAIYMTKLRKNHVEVYEKRPDFRKAEIYEGRSINLALSERGLSALRKVGLDQKVLEKALPMKARLIHSVNGHLDEQEYDSVNHKCIYSISRREINEILVNEAETQGVKFFFDHKTETVSLRTYHASFLELNKTDPKVVKDYDLLIGADGAFSSVRQSLTGNPYFRFECSQFYIQHGYKELCIRADNNGKWRIRNDVLHIWPRGQYMMIALPNLDGSFTVTLFMPFSGDVSFDNISNELKEIDENEKEEKKRDEQKRSIVNGFFQKIFPDAFELMKDHLYEDFTKNPTGNLVTVKTFPHHYKDKIVLIGDAAHAVVPFYGQGMNASMQDVEILDELIGRFDGDLGRAISEYTTERKGDVDAIQDLAFQNYVEMRDHVAHSSYKFRKSLDHLLHSSLRENWIPLYTMVSFRTIPYAEVIKRAKRQDRIVTRMKYVGYTGLVLGGLYFLARYLDSVNFENNSNNNNFIQKEKK